jgi:hypothetical protein
VFKETLFVRLWALRHVKLLWLTSPSVVEMTDSRVVIRIPLNWRTRNHLRSMYFGALCIGADCAGGLMAMRQIEKSGQKISLIFKDLKADFLKRAEGDVHFTCDDGIAIRELVSRTILSGERESMSVNVTATVPSKLGHDPVAKFVLTLSLKGK